MNPRGKLIREFGDDDSESPNSEVFWTDYYRKGNGVPYTRLRYHIVFGTKSRKPYLQPELDDHLDFLIKEISTDIGGCTMAFGAWYNHIHVISAIPPRLAVSSFVRQLKSRSTGAMKATFEGLGDFAWRPGFGAFTLNPGDISTVYAYVLNQRENHSRHRVWHEFERV